MPATGVLPPAYCPYSPKIQTPSVIGGERLLLLKQRFYELLELYEDFKGLQGAEIRISLFYGLLQYRHVTEYGLPLAPYVCDKCFEKHLQEIYKIKLGVQQLVQYVEHWKEGPVKGTINEMEDGVTID